MMIFHTVTISSEESSDSPFPIQAEDPYTANLSRTFIPGVYQAQPEEECVRQSLEQSISTSVALIIGLVIGLTMYRPDFMYIGMGSD